MANHPGSAAPDPASPAQDPPPAAPVDPQRAEALQALVDRTRDCLGVFSARRDGAGRIVDLVIDYINPAAAAGRLLAKLVGAGVLELRPELRAGGIFDSFCAVIETGEPLSREVALSPDASEDPRLRRWFDVQAAKLGDGLVAAWRDVTERRRAADSLREGEERLRLALTAGKLGIWEWDVATNAVYWSPQVYAILGRPPGSGWTTLEEFLSLVHPEDRQAEWTNVEQALAKGVPQDSEFRLRHADGQHFWVASRGLVFRHPDGSPRRMLGTVQDITERKRAEQELHRAREEALAASRLKSQFLANMSHELRTPMNGVLGLLELTLGTELSATQREYLTLAQSSAESLLSLLNGILDLSKIEARKMEAERVPLALAQVVAQAVLPLSSVAGRKGLRLEVDIDAALPPRLLGDPLRLRQVLTNLLGNAIKFTGAGGVWLRALKAGGALALEVRDSGIGIPTAKLDQVFDAFSQADASTTRIHGGTGLGLTISRELVRLMGGELTVESAEGVGSCFRFTLPLVAAPEAREATSAASAEPPAVEATRRLRVLLVEDIPINAKVATVMLEKLGHEVTLAEDGSAALAQIEAGRFDLVLMDIQMPVMDGLTATRRLREREAAGGRRLPVIALTANAMKGDDEDCLAAGMDGCLHKPVRSSELRAALQRFCPP